MAYATRFERDANDEAERRVQEDDGLSYDMEVDAFIAGALWAHTHDGADRDDK